MNEIKENIQDVENLTELEVLETIKEANYGKTND